MKVIYLKSSLIYLLMGINYMTLFSQRWNYPEIIADSTVDLYYGKQVVDPFRNLENYKEEKIQKWLCEQRAFHDSIINTIPFRDTVLKKIKDLIYTSNITLELPVASHYNLFYKQYLKKEKTFKLIMCNLYGNNKTELFSTDSLNLKYQSFFTIDYYEPSPDGKFLAFAFSENGNEESILCILDIQHKKILKEKIERAVGGNPQWLSDGSGFFYGCLKDDEGNESKKYEDYRIKLHRLGTDPDIDRIIFSRKATPQISLSNIDISVLHMFPSSEYVTVSVVSGTSSYLRIFYAPLDEIIKKNSSEINWKCVLGEEDKITESTLVGNTIYFISFNKKNNGTIEYKTVDYPYKRKVVFDKNDMIIRDLIQTSDAVYFVASSKGIDSLYKIDISNYDVESVNIPLSGTIDIKPYGFDVTSNFSNNQNLIFGINTWNKAWSIYSYNDETKKINAIALRPSVPDSISQNLVIENIEVKSHDDEYVPLTILYNSNLKMNTGNPTILYAYGAYGTSITPFFSSYRQVWSNLGGVYAIAHVRGGGEKGNAWYKDGFKSSKSNSWKDFIACAEYLIQNNYTSTEKLAVAGGSAGGITIGRASTERPDLFKVAIIYSGVLNTLRHEISSNNLNITEYGTVNDSVECQYLYEMDTYHHIEDDEKYPSFLFKAGMNDARVEPWHSSKMVAKLQANNNSENIILFRVSNQGHMGDSDSETELADEYSFLLWQLNYHSKIIE